MSNCDRRVVLLEIRGATALRLEGVGRERRVGIGGTDCRSKGNLDLGQK